MTAAWEALSPWSVLGIGWGVMAVVMASLWLLQRRTGDAGVVDVAWTLGVGFLAALLALHGDAPLLRRVLLGGLAGLWALRLATHLLKDRILGDRVGGGGGGGGEDGRYASLRERWGTGFQAKLFWFFQVQAVFDLVLALPFVVVAGNTAALGVTDVVAVVVFVVALTGEWIADRQLAAFRGDPGNRGKTCRSGLWRWSRHPNYFFEWLHWWTYPLLAWNADLLPLALVSPVVMYLLVNYVTGIPPTEEQALRSRGDDYRRYQRTTSAFFPWFTKTGEDAPADPDNRSGASTRTPSEAQTQTDDESCTHTEARTDRTNEETA